MKKTNHAQANTQDSAVPDKYKNSPTIGLPSLILFPRPD